MPRTRPPYPQAFRDRIVELARSGRSVSELAEEFEPSDQTIRSWIKKADVEDGVHSDGTTSEAREELRRLRKELRRLKQERDILAKATALSSRETGEVPPQSSSS